MEKKREEIFGEFIQRNNRLKKVVIDTNILIDYVNKYASWVEDVLSSEEPKIELIIPTVVIGEYFASKELDDVKNVKIADETFALFKKQDLTEDIAKVLGTILRHKSYPTGASTIDLIVASTSIYLSAELATRNKDHFAKIPDLRFFNPKTISTTL